MTTVDFPQAAADIFSQMDGGIRLTEDEIKGRNTWVLWTAGNQVFWDRVAREGYGLIDLLKTLDARRRPSRFAEMGLVNEPGFRTATRPDLQGLWLDERVEPAPAGIYERIYGRSSGVIGFRIYPNPDFDEKAKRRWDPDRYYTDPVYFSDPKLVRKQVEQESDHHDRPNGVLDRDRHSAPETAESLPAHAGGVVRGRADRPAESPTPAYKVCGRRTRYIPYAALLSRLTPSSVVQRPR